MKTFEELREKMKKSNIVVPPFPENSYHYEDLCIVPGNDKYFTSKEEVDTYFDMLMEREFGPRPTKDNQQE